MIRLEQIRTRWEQDKLLYSDVEWLINELELTIDQCNEAITDRDKEIERLTKEINTYESLENDEDRKEYYNYKYGIKWTNKFKREIGF